MSCRRFSGKRSFNICSNQISQAWCVSETVKEMKERYPEIYVLFEKQVDEEQVSACLTQVMLERIARAQAKCK